MYMIQYDYLDDRGFLETETIKYLGMKEAQELISHLKLRNDVRGKPILQKMVRNR